MVDEIDVAEPLWESDNVTESEGTFKGELGTFVGTRFK